MEIEQGPTHVEKDSLNMFQIHFPYLPAAMS